MAVNERKQELMEQVFNEMFKLEPNLKAKGIPLNFRIMNPYLETSCQSIYKQRNFSQRYMQNYNQFKGDYIATYWEVMLRFEATEQDWQRMLFEINSRVQDGKIGELGRYLNVSVRWEMLREFDDSVSILVRHDGARARVFLDTVNFSTLENEEGSMHLEAMADKRFMCEIEYFKSEIDDWFERVKDDVLTKSQVEFLERLEVGNWLIVNGSENEELEEILGTDRKNVDGKLQRIASRLIERFKRDFPEFASDDFNEKLRLRNKFITIATGVKYAKIVDGLSDPVSIEM